MRRQPVRSLLRSLPGEDQYSRGADPSAQQGGEAAIERAEHSRQPGGDGAEGGGDGLPSETAFRAAQKMGRLAELPLSHKDGQGESWISWMPGMLGGWTQVRDLQVMPKQTFREWFEQRGTEAAGDGRDKADGTAARELEGDRTMSAEAASVSSRDEVLRRIRAAIGEAPADAAAIDAEWNAVSRNYKRAASLEREAILELLEDRLRDYDATVVRVKAGDVSAEIGRILTERGKRRAGDSGRICRMRLANRFPRASTLSSMRD